jgi:hypothetical protein
MRYHAMKSLRINPAGNGRLLRLALVVITLYAALPAQLVWCHEEGRSPRMEAGFNGQCLAVAASHCCRDGQTQDSAHPASRAESVGAGHQHDQCIGCSDRPAHHQQSTDAAVQYGAKRVDSGGCLFSLAAARLGGTTPGAPSSQSLALDQIPLLPILHARTICLLI